MNRRSAAGENREQPGASREGGAIHSRKGSTKRRDRVDTTRGVRAVCHDFQSSLVRGGSRVGEEWEGRWRGWEPSQKDWMMHGPSSEETSERVWAS